MNVLTEYEKSINNCINRVLTCIYKILMIVVTEYEQSINYTVNTY